MLQQTCQYKSYKAQGTRYKEGNVGHSPLLWGYFPVSCFFFLVPCSLFLERFIDWAGIITAAFTVKQLWQEEQKKEALTVSAGSPAPVTESGIQVADLHLMKAYMKW
jgi:hypothetical protein